jgi:hypothetical protein
MASIRLNKQEKTIKVVNRKDNIRLKRQASNVTLRHTGRVGPDGKQGDKGDKGDTGVSTMMRVLHGTNGNMARPDALYVEWMGSAIPLNGTTADTWIVTP